MNQAGWESPWGRGRPGWHIECSAMSAAHLGETFDIHAGGIDLIFPHHENEIAQSRSAFGQPFMAKYWMHNGFLNISGEKMSKSLGNFLTVHELLDQYPGEAIRLLLLSAHYRQPLDFTHEGLTQAKATLDRWYGVLRGRDAARCRRTGLRRGGAVGRSEHAAGHRGGASAQGGARIARRRQCVGPVAAGCRSLVPLASGQCRAGPGDAEIEAAIAARQAARKAKDFKESDRIRDELKARGVILEDGPKGTSWKRG